MIKKTIIEISRNEAIKLIKSKMNIESLDNLFNRDLEYIIEDIGYGDNPDWEYYGHIFFVVNQVKSPQD
jgi:hypothetical protein